MKNSETFEVLTPADTELVMTRLFDATPELVFDALTRPEYIKQWMLGPEGWSMTACDFDVRVGGRFRLVWRDEEGNEWVVGGEYTEIDPPGLIVHTEYFNDDEASGGSVETDTIVSEGEKTRLTMTMVYPSKEICQQMIESGMAEGNRVCFDRMEEIFGEAATAA
ncbi:MAG: SRPBCC domain-containing protein [Aridibacter famidurans]|nr:SRPBCC domain-containing protein [Aridibacter famidurans]